LAIELGIQSFLEFATFVDVIDVQNNQNNNSINKDYLQAIQYYFKYDSFLKV
jgi:hypothetical protein